MKPFRHIKYEQKKNQTVKKNSSSTTTRKKKRKIECEKISLSSKQRKCFKTKVLCELGTSLFMFTVTLENSLFEIRMDSGPFHLIVYENQFLIR